MWKNIKIGPKLIAVGVLIVLVPLLVVAFFAVTQASTALASATRDQMASRALEYAQLVDNVISDEVRFAYGLASDSAIVEAATAVSETGTEKNAARIAAADAKIISMLAVKEIADRYEGIPIVDSKGTIFATNAAATKGMSLSDRQYVKDVFSGKAFALDVVLSKNTGLATASIAVPVKNGTKTVGVAIIVMKINSLTDLIAQAKLGKTGYAFVVNKEGIVIAHPVKENILKLNEMTIKGMETVAQAMIGGKSGIESYVYQGVAKTAAFAPSSVTGWSVCLNLPDSEFLAAANQIRNIILIVAAVAFAAACLIFFLFSRSISNPLKKGVEFAAKVAEGDLTARIDIDSGDEIGILANALRDMVDKLSSIVADVR